jgi:hypothetical protein
MKRLKSLMIGTGVAIFNVGTAITQVFRPERCTGSCGSCGFSCVNPAIGLFGIGVVIIMFKKFKGKFNRAHI